MFLIVGLGNPGPQYAFHRHNIGFMVIDALAQALQASSFGSEKKALVSKVLFQGHKILLVKPQTFMNLSGESVQALVHYYKIKLDHLLVVHDDLDLPFGQIKFLKNRGPGGQNGVKSIHSQLGTKDYYRLKMGIGRPQKGDVASYVLQNFSKEEQKLLPSFLELGIEAILCFIKEGASKAFSLYNGQSILKETQSNS
ncbi:MAG: aminoacyl-tRNA hydrolase [Bdellovibrio sp.]|nr:MAG: aminoacyl-tRNA hydrolase [Bdellovibrio sp.]